jgi:hypothetical protein
VDPVGLDPVGLDSVGLDSVDLDSVDREVLGDRAGPVDLRGLDRSVPVDLNNVVPIRQDRTIGDPSKCPHG